MRRTIAVLAALGLHARGRRAAGARGERSRRTTTRTSSFSRSTTSTVTSQPNTPGSIQVGCCNAVEHDGVQTGWTRRPSRGRDRVPRDAHQELRERNSNTITVGAGDLIGASPLVSALFHDEPTIEAMNALGLDVTGVGNHEFDEGVNELLRMQFGGCHPVDGCQDGDAFAGAVFQYLAANVFYEGTDETIFPPYEVKKIDNAKIAFIGLTLEGTPTIVTPSAVAGLEFRPEVETVNALVEKLRNEQGVQGVRRPPPPGRLPEPARAGVPGPANQPDAYTDVNRCVNFGGAEITGDRERPRSAGQGRRQRAHARAVHLHDRRQARHERVVVRPRDHGHRPRASTTSRSRSSRRTAENRDRDAGRRRRIPPRPRS